MPSGKKKRQAAKKKKELEANNNNSIHEHDDAKSQDDKGSDGGDLSSPASQASQDHQTHHNPFDEGDPSGARPIASDGHKSMDESEQKSGSQDQGVIEIEWSLKPDDGGSSTSRSSSSSSSSSDDESRPVEKERDKEEARVTEIESSGDADVVAELPPIIESIKPVVPVSEERLSVLESAPVDIESSGDGDVVAELPPVIDSIKPLVPVSEETLSVLESAPVDNLLVYEAIKSHTGAAETVTKYEEKVVMSSSDEDSKASPSEVKTDSKGNGRKELGPSDRDSDIPASSETVPPVDVLQRTSVFNFCGLCDLFRR